MMAISYWLLLLDWIGLGCAEIKIESIYQFGGDVVIAVVVNSVVACYLRLLACLLSMIFSCTFFSLRSFFILNLSYIIIP